MNISLNSNSVAILSRFYLDSTHVVVANQALHENTEGLGSRLEKVPSTELNRSLAYTYYMPVHVIYKHSSTSTKVRAVFDASAKSSTGVSLNDTVLVGPTVHSQLLLMCQRCIERYCLRSQIEIYTDSFGGVIQKRQSYDEGHLWYGRIVLCCQ